jgi:hypothetical protein
MDRKNALRRVRSTSLGVQGSGFRVQGSRVQGFKVPGSRFKSSRVQEFKCSRVPGFVRLELFWESV